MKQITRQLSLFEDETIRQVMQAGALVSSIKEAMREELAKSKYSRPQVVDRINSISAKIGKRLTQGNKKEITLDTLDKWLNPKEMEHVPGLLALQVFMLAVDTLAPLEAWLALFGCGILTPTDKMSLE